MVLLAGISVCLKQFNYISGSQWMVMCAALGMCLVIIIKLYQGFKKEQAEKASYAAKEVKP
jgi:hypothetical protein